ncbi:MAG: 30S ribosomal protein S12 methylthiotransferase RimO [Firmicutes bacterium]|nr:30S ribosomal protein S12 methylthiotransferase RimO [Bacillota bacterium]
MDSKQKIKVGLVSLGCDKNRVDAEKMLGKLLQTKPDKKPSAKPSTKPNTKPSAKPAKDCSGYTYELTQQPDEAEVLFVNTCSFIDTARKESIDAILEMAEYKVGGKCKKLVVSGCLPKKYIDEIFDELTEVDLFLGTDDYAFIDVLLDNVLTNNKRINAVGYAIGKDVPQLKERVLTTSPHTAYLKIADGCNNNCTYCTIPQIRGAFKSSLPQHLIDEARQLVDNGVKEIILVAQDTTSYGTDLNEIDVDLVWLIGQLSKIEDLVWLRLMYCYPEKITDSLITEIVTNDKVAKYIDVPFQHIDNSVLQKMGRTNTKERIEQLVKKLKQNNIAVRSTFIVGFPQESEGAFVALDNFLQSAKLDNVGFFKYSREVGTPAYNLVQVPAKTKAQRLKQLVATQQGVVRETNQKYIGQTLTVLYEGIDYKKQLFFGRTERQAPDIDGLVYFKSATPLDIGEFYKVKITSFKMYDIYGEVVSE